MKTRPALLLAALLAAATAFAADPPAEAKPAEEKPAEPTTSDHGDHFTDELPLRLDLDGKTREVEKWFQGKWNSQPLSVSNGTLVFTKSMSVHGGMVSVGPDATLQIGRAHV